MDKFKPKGEKEIRQEVIEDLKGGDDNFNADEHKETIDRITQRRIKDENFKASLHSQKNKTKAELKNQLKAKEYYKQTAKPKRDKTETKDKEYLTKDDLANFSKEQQHRNKYSWMRDEEYELVKNESKRTGKGFKEVMESNPVIKGHFENVDIKKRQTIATGAPSNMVNQSHNDNELSEVEKQLDGNLPPGLI